MVVPLRSASKAPPWSRWTMVCVGSVDDLGVRAVTGQACVGLPGSCTPPGCQSYW